MKPDAGGAVLAPLPWQVVVLCSEVLGGAEIFALERLLLSPGVARLHCNRRLAELIASDRRYARLDIRVHPPLDPLARAITWMNLRSAARELSAVLSTGNVVLGNLRAASVQLVSPCAGVNHAFVHDNTNYLNRKVRWLVAIAGIRSASLCFPCRHSTLRLPLRRLLARKLRVEYFGRYEERPARGLRQPGSLRLLNIGRIEENKNQAAAVRVASQLAKWVPRVSLTLLGDPEPAYWQRLREMPLPANVDLEQARVARSEVGDVLDRHDAVLHTSRIESLPLVLFEANARGVPFFALRTGGIPEVLPERFLLADDPAAAAGQLLQVLREAPVDNGELARDERP